MNAATPRLAVEGFEIAPNRRIIEGAVFDTRHQLFAGCRFVLHVTDRASAWKRQFEAEIDSADTGAE